VATPSGISLAPEGGAHQSIGTPLVGLSQPGLTSFEPAFADELTVVMRWALEHLQAPDGGAVYLRLTTRQIDQPDRTSVPDGVIEGGYWLVPPGPDAEIALVFSGAVAPEVLAAAMDMADDLPGMGILAVTSADRLHADWTRQGASSHAARLLAALPPKASLVTVLDGHPLALSWLGAVNGRRVRALGVEAFGQSADIPDLYRAHGIDTEAIVDAVATVLLDR
jgi:pyruvate dehydrogenase E1 component